MWLAFSNFFASLKSVLISKIKSATNFFFVEQEYFIDLLPVHVNAYAGNFAGVMIICSFIAPPRDLGGFYICFFGKVYGADRFSFMHGFLNRPYSVGCQFGIGAVQY